MKFKIHYAWIILILSFFTLMTAQGVRLSFGAFINPWENEFTTSRGNITLISFISFAIYGLAQPFIGRFLDKYGVRLVLSISIILVGTATMLTFFATSPWQLIIIYGIIASIGFGGASNVAGLVAVSNWFVKKKGLAIGLMSSGIAGGQLLIVPLSIFLIEKFGWHTTVLIYGSALLLIVFPIILIFIRTSPTEMKLEAYGKEKSEYSDQESGQPTAPNIKKPSPSTFKILRTKEYLFLLIPFFICGITTSGLIDTHIIPFAELCGFSPALTGTAVMLLAGFNITGTIVSGYLADRISCKNILTFLYLSRAVTIVILLVILQDATLFGFFVSQSHLLIIFSISFGVVNFATIAPTTKLTTDYFKGYSLGALMGWLYLSHHLGSAVGSYIPGLLFDLTGGYEISFILSIGLLIGAAFLSYSLPSSDNDNKINVAPKTLSKPV